MSGEPRSHAPRARTVQHERDHVWPPYTSRAQHETDEPLVIVSAEGSYLTDQNGRRYLDGVSSWWACTLGHSHPRIARALTDQTRTMMHVAAGGITHPEIAALAHELSEVAPRGLTRTHFSDNGSGAVEVALKIAFQYWRQNGRSKRQRFVCLGGAYHGDTIGAASLASVEEFTASYGPLLFEVIRTPKAASDADWQNAADTIARILRERSDEIAGVFVEPLLQGAAGMQIYRPQILRQIHDATRSADTFLICDEVFTGYGRTGSMWASSLANITPDILCLGKGFTAGTLPMAATMVTERVYDGFRGDLSRALMHGHTFCGHPLGARVAREVLAIYRDEGILAEIDKRKQMIAKAFHAFAEIPGVHKSRCLGMVGAVDLGNGGYSGTHGKIAYQRALERGAYLRPLGDTFYVAPAFNIDLTELKELLEIFEDAIRMR